MKIIKGLMGSLTLLLVLGLTCMDVFGLFGFGGKENWKEEVQLSDGRVIVVDRETLREQGGDEWVANRSGTKPKEYRIRFANPDRSGKMIEWQSKKISPGTWPEIPLILDLESGYPIIFSNVAISDNCEIYSKYIYRNGVWIGVELPDTFEKRTTNLYLRLGTDMPKYVGLEMKHKVNTSGDYRRSIIQVGPTHKVCGL